MIVLRNNGINKFLSIVCNAIQLHLVSNDHHCREKKKCGQENHFSQKLVGFGIYKLQKEVKSTFLSLDADLFIL